MSCAGVTVAVLPVVFGPRRRGVLDGLGLGVAGGADEDLQGGRAALLLRGPPLVVVEAAAAAGREASSGRRRAPRRRRRGTGCVSSSYSCVREGLQSGFEVEWSGE